MIIKWTNRYSRETGFVKSIVKAEKHFVNTFDASEAKKYKTVLNANKAVATLNEIGEGANNDFEVINENA